MKLVLLAYPARFRRRHGDDLIGTMMDVAGPAGPRTIDLFHLVMRGIGQRFRVPSGRPLAGAAVVLAALVAGGFSAAAVSWAAARVQDPAPSVASVIGAVVPVDAADHDDDVTTADLVAAPGAEPAAVVDRVGDYLRDAGWEVSPWVASDSIEARDGDLWLRAQGAGGSVYVHVTRAAAPAYLAATVAGLVIGALAGWLFAAAFAYRIVDARRPLAAMSAGIGLIMLAIPAAVVYLALAVLVWDSRGDEVRSLFWIWDSALGVFDEPLLGLHVSATSAGLALVVTAEALTRRGPVARHEPASGTSS
jgi:ABC-type glycerol-3-phosphate transport system permease component